MISLMQAVDKLREFPWFPKIKRYRITTLLSQCNTVNHLFENEQDLPTYFSVYFEEN
jgi:hypothetical protein